MDTHGNLADHRRWGGGIEVLVRELGYTDAMRFLQQFGAGQGDYTAERDRLARPMTDEELLRHADSLAEQERRRRAG